eukprot:m.159037 g.159037  ORF g.159037 m.159037 type:complete len:844 (-) comp16479_c0_seq6:3-2534(-)
MAPSTNSSLPAKVIGIVLLIAAFVCFLLVVVPSPHEGRPSSQSESNNAESAAGAANILLGTTVNDSRTSTSVSDVTTPPGIARDSSTPLTLPSSASLESDSTSKQATIQSSTSEASTAPTSIASSITSTSSAKSPTLHDDSTVSSSDLSTTMAQTVSVSRTTSTQTPTKPVLTTDSESLTSSSPTSTSSSTSTSSEPTSSAATSTIPITTTYEGSGDMPTSTATSTSTFTSTEFVQDPSWRPNILFIVSDDYSERPEHKIPNLDELAAESVVFPRAYANWPKCAPSRTSYMSGRTNGDLKVFGGFEDIRSSAHPELITMPGYFKNHGYHTAGLGKTFHDRDPKKYDGERSWSQDHWPEKSAKDELDDMEKKRLPFSNSLSAANPDPYNEPNMFFDHTVASRAKDLIDKLQEKKKTQPWFINAGFRLPHEPWQMPIKFWERFKYSDFEIENTSFTEFPKDTPEIAGAYWDGTTWSRMETTGTTLGRDKDAVRYTTGEDFSPFERLPIKVIQEQRRAYAAAVAFMDAQVGRIVRHVLENPDLVNNTIIVFTSDHGYHLSELGQWKKQVLYELGLKVPFYIRDPRFVDGHGTLALNSMAELVDIYPTLADLAGLPVPTFVSGTSLAPAVRNSSAAPRSIAISQSARCHTSQYPQRLYDWARNDCKNDDLFRGPGKGVEIMGYTLRTALFRYTLWISFNYTSSTALWDRAAVAVELFDHRQDTPRQPVFEGTNLAIQGSYIPHQAVLRTILQDNVESPGEKLFRVEHLVNVDVGSVTLAQDNLVYASMAEPQHYVVYESDVEACWHKCLQAAACLGMVVLDSVCLGLGNISSSVRVKGFAAASLKKI